MCNVWFSFMTFSKFYFATGPFLLHKNMFYLTNFSIFVNKVC